MRNQYLLIICAALLVSCNTTPESSQEKDIMNEVTITAIDLSDELERQVVVDREQGQYLGHTSTILLEDQKTILAAYPKGHGRGPIILKKSEDGGKTWSERLPTPESFETSRETPTLKRVVDKDGVSRIILWSGLYPVRKAVSEDNGRAWTDLEPVGDWGGIVAMGFTEALASVGSYLAMFHDDGKFLNGGENEYWGSPAGVPTGFMTLYSTFSDDGGLSWSYPDTIFSDSTIHLCEPGVIRSPDGNQMAVLLRENRRRLNSHVIFSDDEGQTWSAPRELPLALTGDRHTAKYSPDGRLFISFRVISPEGKRENRPFETDWGGWVGTYQDILKGKEGQYVVRLKQNHQVDGNWEYDTAYPGVEILPDGTFVTTTYGHWTEGQEPYILSVRFKLDDLDSKAKTMSQ